MAAQVDGEHLVEVFEAERVDRAKDEDARVVHQHVEPAEGLRALVDRPLERDHTTLVRGHFRSVTLPSSLDATQSTIHAHQRRLDAGQWREFRTDEPNLAGA